MILRRDHSTTKVFFYLEILNQAGLVRLPCLSMGAISTEQIINAFLEQDPFGIAQGSLERALQDKCEIGDEKAIIFTKGLISGAHWLATVEDVRLHFKTATWNRVFEERHAITSGGWKTKFIYEIPGSGQNSKPCNVALPQKSNHGTFTTEVETLSLIAHLVQATPKHAPVVRKLFARAKTDDLAAAFCWGAYEKYGYISS